MQVITHEGPQELADILEQSTILDTIDHGALRLHILECNGQDVIMFVDSNGSAVMVYPCSSFDAEFGGSIHDQARACLRD